MIVAALEDALNGAMEAVHGLDHVVWMTVAQMLDGATCHQIEVFQMKTRGQHQLVLPLVPLRRRLLGNLDPLAGVHSLLHKEVLGKAILSTEG